MQSFLREGYCPDNEPHRRVSGQSSAFDTCGGVWEQLKASASPFQSTFASAGTRCDKCDEAHETARCPYFQGPRDKHADAWRSYAGAQTSGGPQKALRQCIAPRWLSRHSVRVARMPGDGSCLFHSVAFGLNQIGFREAGHGIRQRVAKFIADRPDFEITGTPLSSWVDWDSRITVGSYASRLSGGGLWGGAIEMAACAQIFTVDIGVYEEDYYGSGFRQICDFIADVKPRGVVLLLYSGRSHYDALQDFQAQQSSWYAAPDQRAEEHGASEDEDWCSVM